MPVGVSAYVPLANVTLSASAASVTFSSISQAYRDLVIVFNVVAVGGSLPGALRFNSDTGPNYNDVFMAGTGSSTTSYASNDTYMRLYYYSAAQLAGQSQIGQVNIFDYATTDKHKTVLSSFNNAARGVDAFATRWASSNAVTSFQIYSLGGTNIAAGSTFALYGVSA